MLAVLSVGINEFKPPSVRVCLSIGEILRLLLLVCTLHEADIPRLSAPGSSGWPRLLLPGCCLLNAGVW